MCLPLFLHSEDVENTGEGTQEAREAVEAVDTAGVVESAWSLESSRAGRRRKPRVQTRPPVRPSSTARWGSSRISAMAPMLTPPGILKYSWLRLQL